MRFPPLRILVAILVGVLAAETGHYLADQPNLYSRLAGSPEGILHPGTQPGFGPVTESEFQIYLDVLRSMHEDRSLSIESAADQAGTTVSSFREIELRIQRNASLVERARLMLREAAERIWEERLGSVESESTG